MTSRDSHIVCRGEVKGWRSLYSIKQHGGDDQGVSVRRKNGLSSDANDENREVIRKA